MKNFDRKSKRRERREFIFISTFPKSTFEHASYYEKEPFMFNYHNIRDTKSVFGIDLLSYKNCKLYFRSISKHYGRFSSYAKLFQTKIFHSFSMISYEKGEV